MISFYPQLPKNDVARQGEAWLSCDAASCTKEVKVGDADAGHLPAPKDWRVSDPDGNALEGSAGFCPTHAKKIVLPEEVPAVEE